jgi:Protein of unknown function (DUF4038)/Putative collagen-binding domain of a collagenase
MRHYTTLLLILLFGVKTNAQSFPNTLSNGRLKVSDNKRFLVHENGKPFFWMGDTAWELFHRLNKEQAIFYLKKRAEQGFTVVQAVALAEFDGLHAPNTEGDTPLINDDPRQPNEKYFQHMDFIIDEAAKVGIVIALLPTWGDKVYKNSWGNGPEVFTADNAKVYGKWIGMRYKDRKNVLWLLGGDRNPRHEADVKIWREMAAGVVEGVGGQSNALISFHPQPNEKGSAEWFHTDEWLDFNMFQTGHCRETPVYNLIQKVYDLIPAKPVIDGEPIYEDHPVCFNKELGISNAFDVRKAIYFNIFAGAFGATYGCHDIWQMYSPYRPAVNNPRVFWQEALDLPAATQMQHVRRLLESRPMLDRLPDESLIVENNLDVAERIQATRGKDYAFIYTAKGREITVNMGKVSGEKIMAYWFDPRNGSVKEIGNFVNKGQQKFKPISEGYNQDWVLILDDINKKYAKP